MILRDRTEQADFFFRYRSCESVSLPREKSLFLFLRPAQRALRPIARVKSRVIVMLAACQFLQSANTRLAVIHRAELVQIQQLGQLAGIDAVILVADFQQGILARIADQHSGDVRLEQTGALL
jgi:hypothetical protein